MYSNCSGKEQEDYAENVIAEHLADLAARVDDNKPRFIFIDNLDFTSNIDQIRLNKILTQVARANKRFVIIMSGRPMVVKLARAFHREFLGSISQLISHLPYLDMGDVLHVRIRAVQMKEVDVIKDSAGTVLSDFVDGNVAFALKEENKPWSKN